MLAELRLGLGVYIGKKRVARLMRLDGLTGVSHRRKRRGWKPDTATHEDLVKRQFRADAPNRLWFCDIERHEAFLNLAVVKGHRSTPVAAGV